MELAFTEKNIILHEDLNPNLCHACVHTQLNTGNKIVLVNLALLGAYSGLKYYTLCNLLKTSLCLHSCCRFPLCACGEE